MLCTVYLDQPTEEVWEYAGNGMQINCFNKIVNKDYVNIIFNKSITEICLLLIIDCSRPIYYEISSMDW